MFLQRGRGLKQAYHSETFMWSVVTSAKLNAKKAKLAVTNLYGYLPGVVIYFHFPLRIENLIRG
jgi:hypothetical protein